ncbi:MAG: type II secretion system F family protein [Candidatus Omnitrophota bacterium]|jgi:tight adherence protein B
MTRLMILLLLFGSISMLAYRYLPDLMRRYSEAQKKRTEKASSQLDEMFIFTERKRLVRIFTITPLSLGLLGYIIMRNPVGLAAGVALGLISPPIIIKNMAIARRNKFENQLVDALMLIVGALKAGMSLSQAFEVLVEEMPVPMSHEFALLVRENKMGVDLNDCLNHLKKRMPVEDLSLINTAIGIVRDTGGDLTEVLEKLVFTIREKKKLQDRVRALTVQGRMQGYIMMVLPIAFGVFIYFVNPNNFQIMLEDKLGQTLLTWAVISEGIGIILIKKLSKIEI